MPVEPVPRRGSVQSAVLVIPHFRLSLRLKACTVAALIDWFSGLVGYDGDRLRLGQLVEVDRDGRERWRVDRGDDVRGSFESSIRVGRGLATEGMRRAAAERGLHLTSGSSVLKISGNPSKWLQGHNVFGPQVDQLGPVVQEVVRRLSPQYRPADADAEPYVALTRSRVDATVAIDMGTDEQVHNWLAQAATHTRSRHGRAMVSGGTVYWGKSSRRWSLKAYCKRCELQVHPPHVPIGPLRDFALGQLRMELVLRGPELKPRGTLSPEIVFEYYGKVVNGVPTAEVKTVEGGLDALALSNAAKVALNLWLRGGDPARSMSRATFYRYRRAILDEVGIDLSLPRDDQSAHIERAGFSVEELKARWVREVPEHLQPMLFTPARRGPFWPAGK
jgi:hypothetical protein